MGPSASTIPASSLALMVSTSLRWPTIRVHERALPAEDPAGALIRLVKVAGHFLVDGGCKGI